MVYGIQHNGKGKNHLIPYDSDRSELCGCEVLFTSEDDAEFIDGQWYTRHYISGLQKIPEWELKGYYCKKCIAIAEKLESQNKMV